jgi:hypothetical protein
VLQKPLLSGSNPIKRLLEKKAIFWAKNDFIRLYLSYRISWDSKECQIWSNTNFDWGKIIRSIDSFPKMKRLAYSLRWVGIKRSNFRRSKQEIETGDRNRWSKQEVETGGQNRRSKQEIETGDRNRWSKQEVETGDRNRRSKQEIETGGRNYCKNFRRSKWPSGP